MNKPEHQTVTPVKPVVDISNMSGVTATMRNRLKTLADELGADWEYGSLIRGRNGHPTIPIRYQGQPVANLAFPGAGTLSYMWGACGEQTHLRCKPVWRIANILRETVGVTPPARQRGRQTRRRFTPTENTEIIALYEAGAPIQEIAERFECNQTTIWNKIRFSDRYQTEHELKRENGLVDIQTLGRG